ncbi:MAG TPA: nicotinamide-nucleotide amidohydrolase family protein, partial [Planctomycetota bacterium]|nr:nicotinamide-nucleotide amidohydrolase family protein [Planctomycetota bacterium]
GELEAMWRLPVARLLARECPERAAPAWKILRCFGLGESEVQRRVAAVCPAARPGEIGICAEAWVVAVYLAGWCAARARDVRAALEPNVFGEDDDTLATVLVRALVRRGSTCAVAESLTGGGLGSALTAVPGASGAFRGGTIAYAEAEKEALGVAPEILAVHGAVSAAAAEALAAAARRRHGAELGLATSGYAGPGGGAGGDPVGTVYVAAATAAGCRVRRVWVAGGRETVRQVAVNHALALGLEALEEGFRLEAGKNAPAAGT